MNTQNLRLLDEFVAILNDQEGSSDFSITEYLIDNFDRLEEISVNEIVDTAHVSRSSIRRYAQRLGYDNFSILKQDINDIVFPSNIHLRSFVGMPYYKDNLKKGIDALFDDIVDTIDEQTIENLSQDIFKHKNILILSASNTTPNLLKFQQELLYVKKIIHVNNTLRLKETTDNDDVLIIVVSMSGVFAKSIIENINHLNVKKYILTANRDESILKDYDRPIFLSSKDERQDVDGLLGKYGVTFFFDLLSEHYISKYK